MKRTDIVDKVNAIITDRLGLDEEELKVADLEFRNDLGADSLDIVDIAIQIEKEFEIKLSDDEILHCSLVSDVYKLVESKNPAVKFIPKPVVPLKRLGIVKVVKYSKGHIPTEEDLYMRTSLFNHILPLDMWDDKNNMVMSINYQEILCHCPDFREVEDGQTIPHYNLTFKRGEGDITTLENIEEIK